MGGRGETHSGQRPALPEKGVGPRGTLTVWRQGPFAAVAQGISQSLCTGNICALSFLPIVMGRLILMVLSVQSLQEFWRWGIRFSDVCGSTEGHL